MSVQTNYKYTGPIGSAGGIADLAPYAIDTFLNGEENGVMKFGVGVVEGADEMAGKSVVLPADGAKAAEFEGVTTNNRTTEYDYEGKVFIHKGTAIGVMRYGRIFVRVAEDADPAYGDAAYVITSGDEAGYFTNDASGAMAIKGRFLSKVDTSAQVAVVELFNQAQE